jgi:NADPH:quinone reductase
LSPSRRGNKGWSTVGAMTTPTSLQLRTLVTADGFLELSLQPVETSDPKPDEVVVRVEAAPINPSDLGLLLAAADLSTLASTGSGESTVVRAQIPANVHPTLKARFDESMPCGNEGGGVVVAAGSSDAAQALLGKTVGVLGGAMYSQFRKLHVSQCLALPDGTTSDQGAACFVNPLTALCMVEAMKLEGHKALVHTAAASNLGQMLNRICLDDNVDLVNIVRKPEQAALLRAAGAKYVCDSSSAGFMDDLIAALVATGATIAFDATGGGKLASQILTAMEAAANATAKEYSRYGSTTFKQVYIYGGLDRSSTELSRNFGFSWSVGGFLLTPFLGRIGAEATNVLRERVAAEITTTFASHYTARVSLVEALSLDAIRDYARQATGEKYLITPQA